MASVSESEIYWDIKLEVLTELRNYLCKNLPPDKIINYLRSKRVFDVEDAEEIKAENTPTKQRGKLLDILMTKGPTGFDEFCRAINSQCTGQKHILQKILDTLDEKKRDQVPNKPVPAVSGGVASSRDEPKPVTVVTGLPPVPGEYGAPIPPDEINDNPGHGLAQGVPRVSPPPSYPSESPPPYSE